MKRIICSASSIKPNGGDGVNYEMFYAGPGYPSKEEILKYAAEHGYTHIFWASDEALGYKGIYNGDTYVIFKDADSLPFGTKLDAKRYGEEIATEASSAELMNSVVNDLDRKYDVLHAGDDYEGMFVAPIVLIVKSNGWNVYRVIFGGSEGILCFQALQYAFDVNGVEHYDEAHDYKFDKGVSPDMYSKLISKYIEECDADDPKYTIYED